MSMKSESPSHVHSTVWIAEHTFRRWIVHPETKNKSDHQTLLSVVAFFDL